MALSKLFKAIVAILLTPSLLCSQSFTHHGPNEAYGVNDIAFGANNKVFIGTAGGLFESTDLGATWRRPDNFLISVYHTPNFIRNKKTGDLFWYGSNGGPEFFQTKDNGATWIHHIVFMPNLISAAAVYGDSVLLGTAQGLFLKRLSNTTTLEPNAITALNNFYITDVAFEGNLIFVQTLSNGIYWSNDRGVTWHNRASLADARVSDVVISNGNIFVSYVLNGMFVSVDGGATWQTKNVGLVRNNVVDTYLDGGKLYALTDGGNNLYQSSPDATSPWTLVNDTPTATLGAEALAINGNNVLVASFKSIFHSSNKGASWQSSVQGISDVYRIYSMQSASDGSIWAIASHTGVYRKGINDMEFTKILDVSNVGESTLRGDTLPIVTSYQVRMYNVITGNFGRTIPILNPLFAKDYVEVGDFQFIGTMTTGVQRRGISGEWSAFNTGLPVSDITDLKNDGLTLYAATNAGLFKANVNEDQWTPVAIGSTSAMVYQVLVDGGKIFIVRGDGVFVSSDHGVSWQNILTLPNSVVSVIHRQGSHLYAIDYNTIYSSTDNGATWTKQPINNITTEALLATNDRLYLGTLEQGIKSLSFNQDQMISFNVEDKNSNDGPFQLTAISNAGLPVSFTSSDPATLTITNGNQATILKAGVVTITATQAGNTFFKPAEVQKSITINAVVGTEEKDVSSVELFPNPGHGIYTITLPHAIEKELTVSVTDVMGRAVPCQIQVNDSNLTLELLQRRHETLIVIIRYSGHMIAKRFVNRG